MTTHALKGLLAVACWTSLLGCASSAPTEVHLPSQTLRPGLIDEDLAATAEPRPEATEEVAEIPPAQPAPAAEEEEQQEARSNAKTIVISRTTTVEAAVAVTPHSLFLASEREKQRRSSAAAPVIVVTNDNLRQSGEGANVTVAESSRPPAAQLQADEVAEWAARDSAKEEYWRSRALQSRLDWKGATDDVEALEADVAGLRTRFYAEDDPFYRDNEIKPAWDRALDNLAAAKVRVVDAQERLEVILEEGRRDGALPGWLREGLEYEPQPVDDDPRSRRDPREPVIVDEDQWPEP